MFSSFDKAIVGLVMAALFLLNHFGIVPWTPTPEIESTVATIVGIATPLLVYWWPNKKPA